MHLLRRCMALAHTFTWLKTATNLKCATCGRLLFFPLYIVPISIYAFYNIAIITSYEMG